MSEIPTNTGTPEGQQIVNDRKLLVSMQEWSINLLSFGLFGRNPLDNKPVKAKIVFENYDPFNGDDYLPTFTLDKDAAILLINQLWERGIRPTNIASAEGQLEATQKHLADMQRIAFKFIDRIENT